MSGADERMPPSWKRTPEETRTEIPESNTGVLKGKDLRVQIVSTVCVYLATPVMSHQGCEGVLYGLYCF